jgi:hypothetical protein
MYSQSQLKKKRQHNSFFKNNEFDYAELLAWTGEGMKNGLG